MSSPERAPAGADALQVKLVQGIGQIDARTWDACVGPDQPFLRHAFLAALEDSGSASQRTGWLPLHLVAESGGELIGCAPMYLKSHSYGEYVFDWGWASAYERAGGTYYPKLQVAVPFTPVPGPRLLVRPGQGGTARATLAHGLVSAAEQLGVSSLHVTFCREDEWHELGAAGLLKRQGVQYHWHNRGYRDFDDFLASLKHSRRKTIRKERARVSRAGPEHRGADRRRAHARHLGRLLSVLPLDRRQALGRRVPVQALLHAPRRDDARAGRARARAPRGRYVAGALNLIGEDTLYGRIWGCRRQFEFLHFEACYYQAIEFAIERGLARVEAGAQGPHKLQRGYEPVPTYSAHWIRDAGFRAAVERFLAQERAEMACEMEQLRDLLPYRQA